MNRVARTAVHFLGPRIETDESITGAQLIGELCRIEVALLVVGHGLGGPLLDPAVQHGSFLTHMTYGRVEPQLVADYSAAEIGVVVIAESKVRSHTDALRGEFRGDIVALNPPAERDAGRAAERVTTALDNGIDICAPSVGFHSVPDGRNLRLLDGQVVPVPANLVITPSSFASVTPGWPNELIAGSWFRLPPPTSIKVRTPGAWL